MAKTTILVEFRTREHLKRLGNKSQTYDQIINELLDLKLLNARKSSDSLDRGLEIVQSSESNSQ